MLILRHILSLLLISTFILIPLPQAQITGIQAETVEINIWPEYDQSAILVIYNIKLSESVSLPAQVALRIPSAAQKSYSITYMEEANGAPTPLPHRPYKENNWLRLVFTTPAHYLRIEFYDPRLNTNQAQRFYSYEWPADFAADSIVLHIQEPAGATQMQLPRRFGEGIKGNDGLTYYHSNIGPMNVGDSFTLSFSYYKDDNQPSFSEQAVQSNLPINVSTPGRFNMRSALPWLLGALGIILFFTAIAMLLLRSVTQPRTLSAQGTPQTPARAGPSNYCPTCGRPTSSRDHYCRACGTRLKT
jgi:predicted RNA-binding Zn-ribbon protein involved in translation (DUF1610 family)